MNRNQIEKLLPAKQKELLPGDTDNDHEPDCMCDRCDSEKSAFIRAVAHNACREACKEKLLKAGVMLRSELLTIEEIKDILERHDAKFLMKKGLKGIAQAIHQAQLARIGEEKAK